MELSPPFSKLELKLRVCSVSSDEINVPMVKLVRATLDVHERRRIQPNRIFEEAEPEHLIKILSNRERSQSSDEWLSSGPLHFRAQAK